MESDPNKLLSIHFKASLHSSLNATLILHCSTYSLTCFKSLMVKSFISSGSLIPSRIGFVAGPEYGGPLAILSADDPTTLDVLELDGTVNATA